MDKYEYKLKLEQLKNLVAEEDYNTAAEIADSINWKKVRNSNTLCMVGKVYEKLGRYDACREVLLQAYDHSPIGRNIVSRLAENAIRAKQVEEAEEYYNEFLEIAPKDNMRYVLAYQISCLKEAPLNDRIAILEELKEKEYIEKWAYELAALYSKADMRDKCVAACDELILWFGEGEYVEKALNLKRIFQPLTPSQEEKYRKSREQKGMVEISIPKKAERQYSHKEEAEEITVTASKFNTQNLQEELANSMRQIMNATEKETVSDTMDSIKKIVSDIPYLSGENAKEEAPVFDKEEINKTVDETLREDFKELLGEDADGQINMSIPQRSEPEEQISGQMSIEDVLADWEKTKKAAEAAIAAAEQKKLEMAKQQALSEAGEIMERLKTLIPILSATPGEDLPEVEAPVAAALVPEETAEAAASVPEETTEMAEPSVMEAQEEEPAAETSDSDGDDKSDDMPSGTGDFNATREMPDISAFRNRTVRVTPEEIRTEQDQSENAEHLPKTEEKPEILEKDMRPDSEDQGDFSAENTGNRDDAQTDIPAEEEDLEKILAQATQVMMENAKVEVPVENASNLAHTEKLPEIAMPEDLVPSGRTESMGKLTEEQKELFSYFLPVPGMEEQICQILMGATERIGNSITSLTGNILIQGEEGSGKTVLATSLIKAIQEIVGKQDAKIGKISAESLNHKDFAALVPKIAGGYLIVEKAGDLDFETAVRMSQIMEQNTQGMVVVLEDTKAGIKKALNLDFGFAKKFTEKINIPIFTIDELVDFGKSYAEEMECTIDEMGVLALYNRINNIQKLERATTLAEVKDIVDEAIESAEGGGIKRAFGSIFSKKYNENDYLILREKDFEN